MKKHLLFAFIFFACPLFQFGQNSEIDSLKRVLRSQKADTNKLSILLQLTELNSVADKKLFLEYNEQSYTLADILGKSCNSDISRKGKKGLTEVFGNIGWMHYIQDDFEKVIVFENKRLRLFEELNDTNGVTECYHNIATVYIKQKMPSKALPFFLKSLEVRKASNDKQGIAFTYEQIALVYIDLFDFSKAFEYLQNCLVIREELKESNAKTYNSIGLAYDRKGDANKAIEYYTKSLVAFKEQKFFYAFPELLERMSNIEFKRMNYDLAHNYADSIIQITKRIDPYSRHRINAEQLLSKIYSVGKNYKLALEHFQIYTALQDSMEKRYSFEAVAKKQMEFEFKRSEDLIKAEHNEEIAVTNANKKRQNIVIIFITIGLIVVSAFSVFVLRSLQARNKQNEIIVQKEKETQRQKHLVEEKNKDILDSIRYAKRIQMSLLPTEKYIDRILNEKDKSTGV